MKNREQFSERTWNLQDAKARLSELVDRCSVGEPQIILRRGEPAAVVISFSEYELRRAPKESLLSFFQRSPFYGLDLDFDRSKETIDQLRDIDL